LEFEPFQADESTIAQHRLVAATEQFLRRHWSSLPYQRTVVFPSTSAASIDGDAATVSEEPLAKKRGGKPVVANVLMISLSGGVDSMVISKILQWLQQHQPGLHIAAIVAVHIDYANRPESGREAAYVAEWSAQLGIQCRIRVVNEVTRGITDRDAYEKIARNIRYGFYTECIQDALAGAFFTPSFVAEHAGEAVDVRVSGMMFGHHLGDVQENIISNVMRYVALWCCLGILWLCLCVY
jgi:asparagine synthetase B (glutamine-hydrolysing)